MAVLSEVRPDAPFSELAVPVSAPQKLTGEAKTPCAAKRGVNNSARNLLRYGLMAFFLFQFDLFLSKLKLFLNSGSFLFCIEKTVQ